MVVTADMVQSWSDACDEFEDAGKEDAYSLVHVKERWPGLNRDTACHWAIYGLVVQDELSLEQYFSELAKYILDLRAQNWLLKQMVKDRQVVMDEQLELIKRL